MFHLLCRVQVRQEYITGHVVILERGEVSDDQVTAIIQLAALQIKSNDQVQMPTQ